MNEKVKLFLKVYSLDMLVIAILAPIIGYLSFKLGGTLKPIVFFFESFDTWFESDIGRVIDNMTVQSSSHWRTNVHPVFSLFLYFPTFIFRKFFDFSPIIAARAVTSGLTLIWTASFYSLMRMMKHKRIDSILFTLLALISSSSVFWMIIPETFLPGSITIVFALFFALVAENQKLSEVWFAIVSAITSFFTVTNWMVGIIISFVHNSRNRAIQISINALTIVTSLWVIQKYIFPSSMFFLYWQNETNFVNMESRGTFWNTLISFFSHSMVMPAIQIVEKFNVTTFLKMTVQYSNIGSSSIWGIIASVLWGILLAFGVFQFFNSKNNTKFKWILGLSILGQFTLHLVYGDETFLYSLHYMPLLVTLASFSLNSRYRTFILILTLCLIVTAGMNNFIQFGVAASFY